MTIIKWRKADRMGENEKIEIPFYKLYAYTDKGYGMEIGYIKWDEQSECWIVNYNIPPFKNRFRTYENYKINDINEVFYRALLDIQFDLARINNMCVDYCNAISDYIIDYIQGIDHNED